MKHKIDTVIALFTLFLGVGVAGVRAQAPSKVQLNIPFEFTAGKTTLKSGVYIIKRLSGENVILRSEDGKSSVVLNAPVSLTSSDPEAVERLVFSRYGEEYVLSQIWLTADSGRQVWTNKKHQKSERIEIARGSRNSAK